MAAGSGDNTVALFLAGDVMTGRGIDQVLPHPADARLYESYVKSAKSYVDLAESANGPIEKPVAFDYIWGDALGELDRRNPDARIINLETAITGGMTPEPKGINYKMSPANMAVLAAAGIDCCVLANNHVLDWGRAGLLEGIAGLDEAGIAHTGAGRDDVAAAAPAILPVAEKRRVLVFAYASPTAGVPFRWAASGDVAGVNLVPHFSRAAIDRIGAQIDAVSRPGDVVVVSIHWGGNWGFEIGKLERAFAHRLIEDCRVDIVHGHSSHHVKGIEVHRGKLILYGCGDFIDDYEGIRGYEEFRDDLVLMYFPVVRGDGTLVSLEMVPLQIRRMHLNRASDTDAEWLAATLDRESSALGARVGREAGNVLRLAWP